MIVNVSIPVSAWALRDDNRYVANINKLNNEDLNNMLQKYPCVIDCITNYYILPAMKSQGIKTIFAQCELSSTGTRGGAFYAEGPYAKTALSLKCKVTPLPGLTMPPTKFISSLSVGDTIEVGVKPEYQHYLGKTIVWRVADKNHSGYPVNSVTLITDRVIQIMAFDAKEPNNTHDGRKNNGNDRYIYSNIHQWLNSNQIAGNWYAPQHSADQAPTTKKTDVSYNPYTSWAGFLTMLDQQFASDILTTTLTVAKPTLDGGGAETVTDKMFLASTTEMGLANENNIAEGSKLVLFSDDNSRIAYPTPECVSNSDGYSDDSFNASRGWNWWLRTPTIIYPYSPRFVNANGSRSNNTACSGHIGIRPLCNLPSVSCISKTKNQNGHYEFLGLGSNVIGGSAISAV